MKKSALVIFLAALLAALFTVAVSAESDELFKYSLKPDDTYIITEYIGEGINTVVIPETLNGKNISELADGLFYKDELAHTEIVDIVVPQTVTKIGDKCFEGTSFLADGGIEAHEGFKIINHILIKYYGDEENIVIPSDVAVINHRAFEDCESIKTVEIPDGLTKILNHAFDGCANLTAVNLPGSIEEIGLAAFKSTAVENIVLPYSVPKIAQSTFSGCKNLKTLIVRGDITAIEKYAFNGCENLGNIYFEDVESGATCTVMPGSVEEIGYGAFNACKKLKEITLGVNVAKIGDLAFTGCFALGEIGVPETAGIDGIGDYAFGFSLTKSTKNKDSYVPGRISGVTINILGTAKSRRNIPILRYCYDCSADGFFDTVDYTISRDTLLGDTDGDGKIKAKDARIALRISAGLDEMPEGTDLDMTFDGKTTAKDARTILRMAAGLDKVTETIA